MRRARQGSAVLAIVCTLGALVACGGDEYRRPGAEPGKVVTVVDGDTPLIPKKSTLTGMAVGNDGVLYLAFEVMGLRRTDPESGLILAVPAKGKPFIVADQSKHVFPVPLEFVPRALTIDASSGTLYLTDSASQRVRAIDPGGRRRNVAEFGGSIQGPPDTFLSRPEPSPSAGWRLIRRRVP